MFDISLYITEFFFNEFLVVFILKLRSILNPITYRFVIWTGQKIYWIKWSQMTNPHNIPNRSQCKIIFRQELPSGCLFLFLRLCMPNHSLTNAEHWVPLIYFENYSNRMTVTILNSVKYKLIRKEKLSHPSNQ